MQTVSFTPMRGRQLVSLGFLLAFFAGAIAGCGAQKSSESEVASHAASSASGAAEAAAPNRSLWSEENLPATFRGTVALDGRAATEHTLDLWPDGVFFHRTAFHGLEESAPSDDMGHWKIVESGAAENAGSVRAEKGSMARVLTLRGSREKPLQFTLVHADTLRLFDPDAGESKSNPLVLVRQESFAFFEPRLRMRGMFMYMADAGLFRECLTGRRFPVAHEADNAALESAYLQARSEPGAELLVTLEGRIALRPPMEGDGMREFLIVERFVNVWPGERCAPPGSE